MIRTDADDGAPTSQAGPDVELRRLAQALSGFRPSRGPFVVGVTGAVSSGKSTLSKALMAELANRSGLLAVEVVGTDGFLYSNHVLDGLGLTARKGFPESYDVAALRKALSTVRKAATDFPGYSHVIYDIDPTLTRRIDRPDVLIIEGLSLDIDRERTSGERLLDALIYLDADEADIERWFVSRFLKLWQAAEHDPTSFYARFRSLDRDQVAGVARTVWTQVNLPNLREHIIRARDSADIVVHKRGDHRIEAIRLAASA